MGLKYIENDRERKRTFSRRVKTLKKNTRELATLCGIPVALICFGDDQEVHTRPQNSKKILDIITRYRMLSPHVARMNQHTLADYVDKHVLKDVRPISQILPDIPYVDAVKAIRSMDATLHFVGERINLLTGQKNFGRNCSNVSVSYGMGAERTASFGNCQRDDDMDCEDAEPSSSDTQTESVETESSSETETESMETENCLHSEEEATATSADHKQEVKTIRLFGNDITVYTD